MKKQIKNIEYFGFANSELKLKNDILNSDTNSIEHHRALMELFELRQNAIGDKGLNAPVIEQFNHLDYIPFGKDNAYPFDLIDLKSQSSLHDSIIEIKAKYIQGNGFNESKFLESLLIHPNEYINNIALDLVLFGGFYLHIRPNKEGKIGDVSHADFSTIRLGKFNEEGKIDKFFFSADWTKKNKKGFKPIEIPIYNPEKWNEDLKTGQVLQIKKYQPGQNIYALPDYLGAINWIRISSMIAQFHKNNLLNGFTGTVHIHVPGDFTDDVRRRALKEDIKKNLAGTDNAGQIVLTWSPEINGKPVVTNLSSNANHEMFIALNEMVEMNISNGHKMPPILAGLETKTGLAGKGLAIKESLDLFENTVVRTEQNILIKTFERLAKDNGVEEEINISNIKPINFIVSDNIKLKTLTINEIRQEMGFEEIEGGDKFADVSEKQVFQKLLKQTNGSQVQDIID